MCRERVHTVTEAVSRRLLIAEARDFSSSFYVQTGSEAHPASCTVGSGVLSPGVKRDRGMTLTTHPHLLPRERMGKSYKSSPPSAFVACSGTALAPRIMGLSAAQRCLTSSQQ
jgi:hypothetical protein